MAAETVQQDLLLGERGEAEGGEGLGSAALGFPEVHRRVDDARAGEEEGDVARQADDGVRQGVLR